MPHFFLSYRRIDTEGRYLAHMIYREIKAAFGAEFIFLDVDTRSPGLPFKDKILAALRRTDVVLVVIGPEWLSSLQDRSTAGEDWVRFEVSESLKISGLPVVPVCHVNTKLPSASELPLEMRDLVSRDGVTLDPFDGFERNVRQLLDDLNKLLTGKKGGVSLIVGDALPPRQSTGIERTAGRAAAPTVTRPQTTSSGADRRRSVRRIAEISIQLSLDVNRSDQRTRELHELELASLAKAVRAGSIQYRPGDTAIGCRLIRPIGAGNFSTIWEAEPILRVDGQNSRIAIKAFDIDKISMGMMLWRFHRGIRALELFRNANETASRSIVQMYDVAEDLLSFSMELLPGGDLTQLRHRSFTIQDRLRVFVQVAKSVSLAHDKGVIHRDIKPANFVLNADGRPILTDFDIADLRFADDAPIYSGGLGTPLFAAPEQIMGAEDAANPTCDIFSLGKMLFYLVTEKPPPIGATDNGQTPLYLQAVPIPALRQVIAQATRANPADRYQTVPELLKSLFFAGVSDA